MLRAAECWPYLSQVLLDDGRSWPVGSDPPTLSGSPLGYDMVTGYFRWTRGGLKGIDFGGGEVKVW